MVKLANQTIADFRLYQNLAESKFGVASTKKIPRRFGKTMELNLQKIEKKVANPTYEMEQNATNLLQKKEQFYGYY